MNVARDPLISGLDGVVRESGTVPVLVGRALDRLRQRLDAVDGPMAWETVSVETFGPRLPDEVRSCWIFMIRPGAATGAERHPNSHQRSLSLAGSGTFELRDADRWSPHALVSEPGAPIADRWVTIPVGTWHRLFVGREPWGMLSFHTVAATELIEERPVDAERLDGETTRERYAER